MPTVSVVMPSFNYARYLPLAIESVLSQTYSDLELIITDDYSTDHSREIVETYRRGDKRIVPVLHTVNQGLAIARNSAIAVSSGDFIALCDADDIWRPDKLSVQLECFRKTPELGIVHSDSTIMDGDSRLTGQRFSSLVHRTGQRTSGNLFDELCRRNFLCVPTVIVRREAMQYAEGFDARLRSLEDWVCWTRISRRYSFEYIDEPLAQYRIHGGGLSANSKGMASNRVKAIHFLLERFPDISPRVRASMLHSLGHSLLEMSDLGSAAKAFLASVEANPIQLRGWIRCCEVMARLALPGGSRTCASKSANGESIR